MLKFFFRLAVALVVERMSPYESRMASLEARFGLVGESGKEVLLPLSGSIRHSKIYSTSITRSTLATGAISNSTLGCMCVHTAGEPKRPCRCSM